MQGAYDYLTKPIDIDQLRTIVEQACCDAVRRGRNSFSTEKTKASEFLYGGVVSRNAKVTNIFDILRRVSSTNISVLIEGESGTGKELLAHAIHNNSNRSNKAFKPINCAGLTETLLESELFGHAKGAFTGSTSDRKGLFEMADGGTIFLDEIGDMPMSMQAKLLRVLEDGVVLPVGSNKPVVVDVRIISATNHDLQKLISESKFRQDLYFRIKGVSVTLPALRDRQEDIGELANHFINEAAAEVASSVAGITGDAIEILKRYDWPGNIRQLRNTIRTMVVMCDRDKLDVRDIPSEIHHPRALAAAPAELGGVPLNELEKQAIVETLLQTDNNREKAAKILGIGERTLYRKIKEYGL